MRILLASISSLLVWLFIALSCTTTTTTTTAFVVRSSRTATTTTTRSSCALYSSSVKTNTETTKQTSTTSTPSSALITKEAASKSQLFNAFSALDLRDQYDAVLTGLCAKILDNNDNDNNNTTTTTSLDDPLQLLQEMNDQKVAASPRSVMALIDCACSSTATTQDINVMKTVLQLCRSNVGGGTTKYGAQVVHIVPFPISPTQKVICADGISRTRRERLQRVEGIPEDHRQQEVMNAIITMSIVGACEFTNIVLPQGNAIHDALAPEANLILFAMVVIAAIDNFYDVIQSTSKLVLNQISKEKNNMNKIPKKGILPDKDTLPLGLGQGILTGSIVRGFSRLVTVDVEREAQCEAAALYSAYVLGLPCFAFRPNAYEAKLLTTSNTSEDNLTASHILHMLVWLLAPVAMESANHPQLIMSDPREATHYLNQVLEYYNKKTTTQNNNDVLDEETQQLLQDIRNNQDDLLKWAYTEADNLLRENKRQVEAIAQRLAGGAATMGDCVAVMEGWQ